MTINSKSGFDHLISDFDQAKLPKSDVQAMDEDVPNVIGPTLLPSIQESHMSSPLPLEFPIPLQRAPLPFVKEQHPHADVAFNMNSLLIIPISLPSSNSTPTFDPS